ncbi:MAG: hypothetical protein K9K40_04395 [Desulfotignum sp.]|nr:hypothetical protein [Desulfotignum sp.]
MDKLGELKNQLYNFMRNLSHEKPSDEKLDRMLKIMGQMEDVLYEIRKPTICELRKANTNMIQRLRAHPGKKAG